jgi:hypothetical protein
MTMSDLRTAAQQALEAWDTYENGTVDHPLSGVMEVLRAALEQPDPTNQCGETCERAKLCAICAREIEQEQPDTDCHAQGVCQRSGYSIGGPKQDVPEAGCGTMVWMVYTQDGKSVRVTDNPADFTDMHRALPLYTAPPAREPLTEDEIERLIQTYSGYCQDDFASVARAIERAHGIGGNDE